MGLGHKWVRSQRGFGASFERLRIRRQAGTTLEAEKRMQTPVRTPPRGALVTCVTDSGGALIT